MTTLPHAPSRTEVGKEPAPTVFDHFILAIYLIVIFEGALRKWVFPGAFDVLFFVREPVVAAAYIYALMKFGFPISSKAQMFGLGLVLAGIIAGAVNVMDHRLEPRIFGYGIRNYFFYLPLIYIIAKRFTYAGWCRLVAVNIWLQVPLAVLAIIQSQMPGSHWINAGLIENGLTQSGVFGDVIRVYGTFSSSSGQTTFIAFSMAILLWCLTLTKATRPVSNRALTLGSAGTLSMLAVSGSRGAFITTAFLAVVVMASKTLVLQIGWRSVRAVGVLTIVLIVAMVTVFSNTSDALYQRSVGAAVEESEIYRFGIVGRIAADYVKFIAYLPVAPVLGFGVGTFGNANSDAALANGLLPVGYLPEDDWSRNICDLGPVIGVGYIIWRCWLVGGVVVTGVRVLRRRGELASLILASFCVLTVLGGQITGHGSIQGFGFIAAGLAMASPSWFRQRTATQSLQRASHSLQLRPGNVAGRRALTSTIPFSR
jgi:hypothetical protein